MSSKVKLALKKLVIMESPTKTKAVQNYLGDEYLVLSSDGHIRNLAASGKYGLGIDLTTFTPIYKTPRRKAAKIKELKQAAAKASHIYLATDHDREGEAIAYHLNEILQNATKKTQQYASSRITFNEITKKAILAAFTNPHQLNLHLVYSQQARQLLDQIIGFRLSKLLQKKIGSRSAGRVQSVALKLICLREREISNFVPEEFWTINANYQNDYLLKLTHYQNKALVIANEAQAQAITAAISDQFRIIDIKRQPRKRESAPPFTTSTMLQAAISKLNFTTKKATLLAQQLYEGIKIDEKGELKGFISYPRTDSIRLNDEFVAATKALIASKYGANYVGVVKTSKNHKNIQDAHEAIRPTDCLMTPEAAKSYLNREQLKLYQLIYYRTLTSLMAPAELVTTTVTFTNNDYQWKLSGQEIIFQGFLKVDAADFERESVLNLPSWKEGDIINTTEIKATQNFTKPKSRYSEARLIKTLEELGIGRPSTYPLIISTIQTRGYVEIENKTFKATPKGFLTNDCLQEFFADVISEQYTSEVEAELDQIAQGLLIMNQVVKDFWTRFAPKVEYALEHMKEQKAPLSLINAICPTCQQHNLIVRHGRYGEFVACSGFPKCRYIQKEVKIIKKCPKCDTGNLIVKFPKSARSNKKQFLGCTNYPTCNHVETFENEVTKGNDSE